MLKVSRREVSSEWASYLRFSNCSAYELDVPKPARSTLNRVSRVSMSLNASRCRAWTPRSCSSSVTRWVRTSSLRRHSMLHRWNFYYWNILVILSLEDSHWWGFLRSSFASKLVSSSSSRSIYCLRSISRSSKQCSKSYADCTSSLICL